MCDSSLGYALCAFKVEFSLFFHSLRRCQSVLFFRVSIFYLHFSVCVCWVFFVSLGNCSNENLLPKWNCFHDKRESERESFKKKHWRIFQYYYFATKKNVYSNILIWLFYSFSFKIFFFPQTIMIIPMKIPRLQKIFNYNKNVRFLLSPLFKSIQCELCNEQKINLKKMLLLHAITKQTNKQRKKKQFKACNY